MVIAKGNVLATERGLLFVALGVVYINQAKNIRGWHGIGFNGSPVEALEPTVVAKSVNAYINQTYSNKGIDDVQDVDTVLDADDN